MAPTNVTQQTSTALPLQGELARAAPQPKPLAGRSLAGPLQWALEGPGWTLLRPATDFLLMWLALAIALAGEGGLLHAQDRKSTRLNSSHVKISYAVFCLKKK